MFILHSLTWLLLCSDLLVKDVVRYWPVWLRLEFRDDMYNSPSFRNSPKSQSKVRELLVESLRELGTGYIPTMQLSVRLTVKFG